MTPNERRNYCFQLQTLGANAPEGWNAFPISQLMSIDINITQVKKFWNSNPVGIKKSMEGLCDYDLFGTYDAIREADNCEPYAFSNFIHEYDKSNGKKVLDYGCGNGYVLSRYALNHAKVFGLDITEKAIELSKKRFKLMELNGEFIVNNGLSIPFPDCFFDTVCSMGVLHHISDPRPVIRELYRVLKPRGQIILMLYNKNSFRNHITFRIRKYFGNQIYRGKSLQEQRNMNDGKNCPLALVYDKTEVKKLLINFSNVAFCINKLHASELFHWSQIGAFISLFIPRRVVRFLASKIGWNLYVKARKPAA